MADDYLLAFVKRPGPGEAKTRLVPALGEAAAAELYRALAEHEIASTAPQPGDYERLFFFSPPDARAELEAWLPGEWLAQRGADLGERLEAAFAEAFGRGARRAAIIGSDAPWVSRALVVEALGALAAHDVVIVPACDGGYSLVALERTRPQLFRGIQWSTPMVLAQTLQRAAALRLRVRLLDPQPDVDTLADVRELWPRLRPLLATRPALVGQIEAALAG